MTRYECGRYVVIVGTWPSRREHEGMEQCDYERLVRPLLGLFGAACLQQRLKPEYAERRAQIYRR